MNTGAYTDWMMKDSMGLPDYQAEVLVKKGTLMPLSQHAPFGRPDQEVELASPNVVMVENCEDDDEVSFALWTRCVEELAYQEAPPEVLRITIESHRVDAEGHVVLIWSDQQRRYLSVS